MRLVLADDHPLFRDGIRSLLEARGLEVIGEASTASETVRLTLSLRPDLVLMDIGMPEGGGLEATRLIKASAPEVKIIILTVYDDDQTLFEAIKCGADGYLTKNLKSDEFFSLLQGVTRGEPAISPRLASRILQELGRQIRGEARSAPSDELTEREREVLHLVAAGATNREIAERLFITENTVKFHMRNILDKLHLRNRAEAVAYAMRRGLLPPSA
ncbi:MAG: response regulator transcription factor [Bacillota bacterium]